MHSPGADQNQVSTLAHALPCPTHLVQTGPQAPKNHAFLTLDGPQSLAIEPHVLGGVFLPSLEVRDKTELFKQMAQALAPVGKVDAADAERALWDRERQQNTGHFARKMLSDGFRSNCLQRAVYIDSHHAANRSRSPGAQSVQIRKWSDSTSFTDRPSSSCTFAPNVRYTSRTRAR